MRPRAYFLMGSIILFLSVVLSVIVVVFLTSLTAFSLRAHGPMGQFRLDQMINIFPWWAPLLAVCGLILGIFLLKKYEFSYKIGLIQIVSAFILAVLLAVFVIYFFKWDDLLFRSQPMRGMMRHYWQDSREFDEYPRRRINKQINMLPDRHDLGKRMF